MKQTAVEWLIEQMMYQMEIRIENTTIGCDLFEQAKEMEKEQIEETYWESYKEGQYSGDKTADEYYNETFKSE